MGVYLILLSRNSMPLIWLDSNVQTSSPLRGLLVTLYIVTVVLEFCCVLNCAGACLAQDRGRMEAQIDALSREAKDLKDKLKVSLTVMCMSCACHVHVT